MLVGADVVLYEDANFQKVAHRINVAKVASFSISPTCSPYFILCYMPGNYILLYLFNITLHKYVYVMSRYLYVEST